MQFTSSTKVNAIVWITSLREEERGVTRRVTEDLSAFCQREGMHFELHEPGTAADLITLLDGLAAFATSVAGWSPILHLDTHGLADSGIQISATGEFVGWTALADKFRAINVATGNNLIVLSHACFSFHVARELDINKPTPFFMLFAPRGEIDAGTIEANTCGFYRDILTGRDVIEARESWFPEDWLKFHCQEMMAILLTRIIDAEYVGRRAERRKEDMLTKAIAAGRPNNRGNRRRMRSITNAMIKPNAALIARTAGTFLMGQDPGFGINDVMEIVMAARRDGRFLGPSRFDNPT